MPREREARERMAHRKCHPALGFAYPGAGHFCTGRKAEGAVLTTLATAEIGGATAGYFTRSRALTFTTGTAFGNTYIVGSVDPMLDKMRSAHMRFVPQDTLSELLVAPFNGRVLGKPEVWGGTLGMLAAGLAFSYALANRGAHYQPGATPRLFGGDVPPGLAYPAATLTYGGLFSHVAVGEEMLFRGLLQSSFARGCGEACGWALGSAVFGISHASNALTMSDPRQRERYLALGVPYLILAGQVLGGVYWKNRYSLAPSVAMHFWYDLLLSMVDFALEPRRSLLAMRVGLPF